MQKCSKLAIYPYNHWYKRGSKCYLASGTLPFANMRSATSHDDARGKCRQLDKDARLVSISSLAEYNWIKNTFLADSGLSSELSISQNWTLCIISHYFAVYPKYYWINCRRHSELGYVCHDMTNIHRRSSRWCPSKSL